MKPRIPVSVRTGFSFGLTSGIITTLGLMVGLYSGTGSKLAVLGGIITIAVADAFSDSMGIHISEESGGVSEKRVWESTFATFFTKFFVALIFAVPVLLLDLGTAIAASIVLGGVLLALFSYRIAVKRKSSPWRSIAEHLGIAAAVIIVTFFLGEWISIAFI